MEKHYLGHRKRLKEKFLKKPDSLSDYEIVELLLGYVIKGKDTKPFAKDIIKDTGGIGNFFDVNIKNINGIGTETELFIRILKELYYRIEKGNVFVKKDVASSPEEVFRFLKYKISFEDKEKFVVILLNSKGEITDIKIFETGTVNQAVVFVREVAEFAINGKAVSVIIAHNHPASSLKFSESDYNLTERVKRGLEVLEIILQDHILICKDGFLSMRQSDLKGFWR
jgi:DNA repair protein RadC